MKSWRTGLEASDGEAAGSGTPEEDMDGRLVWIEEGITQFSGQALPPGAPGATHPSTRL